jgi:pimeloyl-ACP methyl ester carboxylesterase
VERSFSGFDQLVLDRPGCEVHAWVSSASGREPLIVLLHGAGIDHWTFEPQIHDLSARSPLALLDVRGHAESRPLRRPFSIGDCVDDVVQLLDRLHVERAVLLGQSMGGVIAQEILFRMPERVSALVAADCVCNTLPLSRLQSVLLTLSPGLLRLLPQRLLWASTVGLSSRPEVRGYLSATIRRLSKRELIEITAGTIRALHYEPEYHVPCPLLIVRGEHDRAGAIRHQAPTWAERDHADYVIIPEAGHLSNMDNPPAFNTRVLEFLRGVL